MIVLKIIGIIVILIMLIGLISIGISFEYINKKMTLSAYLCGFLVPLLPKKKKAEKVKKKEKAKDENTGDKKTTNRKKEKKKKKEKQKKGGLALSPEEILALVKKVLEGIGKFNHGWKVPQFMLHYVAAGKDPYDTAKIFNFVNMTLCTLAPICSRRFHCKDADVWTDIDFSTDEMKLDVKLTTFIRIGSIFSMINTILFGGLWILMKNKCRLLWLKITDKEAYTECMEEQAEKKARTAALLSRLKSQKKVLTETEENKDSEQGKSSKSVPEQPENSAPVNENISEE